jgi:hypothetical protein
MNFIHHDEIVEPATQKEINDRIKFQVDRARARLEQNLSKTWLLQPTLS